MKLIDSHSHLILEHFDEDRDSVISNAFNSGITHIVQSCDNLEEIKENLKLNKKYENIYSSVGIHPHEAKTWNSKSREEIINYTREEKVIAIGECGLDYYYNLSPQDTQQKVFKEQIVIAKELGFPLIIHTRDAFEDTFKILEEVGDNFKGVFHCYTGDAANAQKALDLGFYISFSGIVTFKNALALKEAAKIVPLEKMLIETDSPFLAPVPMRGKRNEPLFVKHVAEEIASLRNLPIEEIAKITSTNTINLFGLQ